MSFPYRIATLIYAFNAADEVLLLERSKQPNQGLWSPPGGKLEMASGESPHQCAARESREEIGISPEPEDFHLTGMISEHGYAGEAHWLMFLFELKPRLEKLPRLIDEGRFGFFQRNQIEDLPLPLTDRERIWPLYWQHRNGFFVAHCRCHETENHWTLEQSHPSLIKP